MAARTWLAVALCCFVWFGYMKWFAPLPPEVRPATQGQSSNGEGALSPSTTAATPGTATSAGATGSVPAAGDIFSVELTPNDAVGFASPKQAIDFSTVGGKIHKVSLPEYKASLSNDAGAIEVLGPNLSPLNLATLFTDPMLQPLGYTKYTEQKGENAVTFTASHGGVEIVKAYDLQEADFLLTNTITLRFPKNSDRKDWGFLAIPVGAIAPAYDHDDPLKSWEVVWMQNEKVSRKATNALELPADVLQGSTAWVSFGNRYFATAVANQSAINPDVVLTHNSKFTGAYLRFPIVRKEGQAEVTYQLQIYSGPKEVQELGKIPGLKQLMDYGMFSVLAYPMLEVLRFLYKWFHNYGIAIILLTVFVRLLFYPLSVKSMRSMKSMQRLQPQIAALREKYKEDPQRFNQEQMALFKTHKVNPLGGCLPMLVQLPVFIALYAVLGNSLELFHAPFFGWIHDLSSKDPYYVYPILMGLAMLLQTKMTPTATADPIQQKMMYLMPVVFTFIMLKLPSGLTLYIFVSTLLGILQQWAMKDPGAQTTAVTSNKNQGAPEKG